MAKKKICFWLNSNEAGNIVLRHGRVAACCTRELILIDGEHDYTKLSYDDIQNKRKELIAKINSDSSPCIGCGFLHETEERNIDVGKLGYVIYHPNKTCNLKCTYCSFARNGDTLEKFDKEKYNTSKVISHFHNLDLFKDEFTVEFGVGEPLLLDGIPESIDLLSKYYPKSTVLFVSNFTLANAVDKLIPTLSKRKIRAVLKTSVDCGTRETYKKIRNKDLYDTLKDNLLKAAKNNAFDEIMLKYIFLDDGSNATKSDITGFIKLVKEVRRNNPNTTTIILDADQTALFSSNFKEDNMLQKNVLKAVCKIFDECKKIGCEIKWIGERLSFSTPIEQIFSIKMKETIR